LFGINGLAIVTGSFIIGRFSGILHERSLLRIAVITAVSATSVLLIMTMLKGPLATIVIPIFIYMISIGMTITGSVTLAMKNQGHRAGSASAVLGMLPLTLGSIVSPLVGINETTAIPMAAILFSTALLGFVAFFTLTKNKKETEKCDVNEFKTEVSP
jgi:DHA1 family bicyclomycin/chloramphenicol resistance-like MFS transporter